MTHLVLAPVPAGAGRTPRATPAPATPSADIDAGREPRTIEEVFTP